MLFDLASLTKPLVTAPLALQHLDLDQDRRAQLGFTEREEPLTVRQLLSHSSGLPPWLPYTTEPLARQLSRGFPEGVHPLLRRANVGQSTYSDLNFRLLGELLELETGQPFAALGKESTGFEPAPWSEAPVAVPDGPDGEAWALAAPEVIVPTRSPFLPHDANARAGMRGHAGFGTTPEQMKARLDAWIRDGFPQRMAVETARAEDGTRWGLSLQRALSGENRFGQLLSDFGRELKGVQVITSLSDAAPAPLGPDGPAGEPTAWWMHFGYTGCALFVRPEDGTCIALMTHRRGPSGELLDPRQITARRWHLLHGFLKEHS